MFKSQLNTLTSYVNYQSLKKGSLLWHTAYQGQQHFISITVENSQPHNQVQTDINQIHILLERASIRGFGSWYNDNAQIE